ncbi:MAG: N-acetylmuramoyl-L-alanine amidase [Terriglobales bacterium]
MNATPTRPDWQASSDPALPLEQGVRVLASLGNQEGLRALLAFSALHENIRERRQAPGSVYDQNQLQTERFVLHEVLQLICARTQALTQADGILIALAEGGEFVCRAAAGSYPISQGSRLNRESKFLRDALESGKIVRCDDSETDPRVQDDTACQLGARASLLVPLRGRREHLGVLQAFSAAPWSFTDHDIRCLDLFAELILGALKPADQDRRLHWLGDVAGEVLQAKPAAIEATAATPTAGERAVAVPTVPIATNLEVAEVAAAQGPSILLGAPVQVEPTQAEVAKAETAEIKAAAAEPASVEPRGGEPADTGLTSAGPAGAGPANAQPAKTESGQTHLENEEFSLSGPITPEAVANRIATSDGVAACEASAVGALPDLGALTEPIVIPVEFEFREPEANEVELPTYLTFEGKGSGTEEPQAAPEELAARPLPDPFLLPLTSRPGLSVVLVLVLVAGLFSAGVWWGMQAHTSEAPARIAAAPKSVTTPPAPDVLAPSTASNLMAPVPGSGDAAPTPVDEAKLAALPKITGVRHWSSSMGSTVVIDMEDQVNYEVHRLMSPDRIYFDLHDTALPTDLDGKTMDVGDASLTSVRVAQPIAGVTRIVLDTKNGSNFSVSMETNPYRLVVELRDSSKSLASNRSASTAPAARPATAAPLTALSNPVQPLPARAGKLRIVLDAGHGGWDLGTVGRQGLLEKDLVLDVTRRLGRLLQSRNGADVMFTRTGDDYVALDQRADFANQMQADLFVSVHANYSNSATARGVETYYTNLFSAPGLKEIEKHVEGTSAQPIALSADSLHDKTEESRRLAASVQRSLYATLAAKSPDIRDRGIKDASFVVLTGTTMPAILTEISFVSSPADEHNLQSDGYRQQIAEALYKGITHYEESFPKAKVAQLRPASTGR